MHPPTASLWGGNLAFAPFRTRFPEELVGREREKVRPPVTRRRRPGVRPHPI
ncbi:MAG: hypothetical protein QXR87_04190 [Candidatus Hadarchaeales archaeon]